MSAKYCRHCGKPVPEDSNFCPNCGGALNETHPYKEEKKSAQIYAILAFWLLQVYLAYSRRPYRFKTELFWICCGLFFSLLIYVIFCKKTGTLLVSILAIVIGWLAYFFLPIALSTLVSQPRQTNDTRQYVTATSVPTRVVTTAPTRTQVVNNTPTPEATLHPFYLTQTAIVISKGTRTRVPTATPTPTRTQSPLSRQEQIGTYVAEEHDKQINQ